MTFAEVDRQIESYNRTTRLEAKERAMYDYILADLIGRSNARVHASANKMPAIDKVYPSLFDSEEIQEQQQKQKAELSALRFRNFTNSFNQRYKEVGKTNE